MKTTHSTQSHTGFTLIEVMVSVSIFAIILTIGIGSLLTINNAYRKSQSERIVIDNIQFAMESMSREIRVGTKFVCAPSCSDAQEIRFVNPEGLGVRYRIEALANGEGRIVTNNNAPLTDPSVVSIDTNESRFVVQGELLDDGRQPYVIIQLTGTAIVNNQKSRYSLQTSVSQRQLDLPPLTP